MFAKIIMTAVVLSFGFGVASAPRIEAADTESTTQTTLDSTSNIDDYVLYAVEQNPFLRAYYDKQTAAIEAPSQAGAMPDPTFAFGYFFSSPETRLGAQEWTFRLSQKLPFFGKRGLRRDVAQTEADAWANAYDDRLLDLVRDVRHAYYDYFRVHETTRITRSEKDVIRGMQNIAQVKYASGLASQQDVLKAQLALSHLDDRLTTLRRDLVSATARLNELLGRDPDAALADPSFTMPTSETEDVERLYEIALANRPDIAIADLGMVRAEKSRALAKREYYPDLTLSLNYVTVSERPVPVEDNGRDIFHVGAAINVPIWFGPRGAAVAEAEASIAMARNEKIGLQVRIKREVRDAFSRVESARELVKLHRDVIIPQAEQTFRASEAGYQTGQVDFLNYLDSERMLLSVRQSYFALVADLGRQYADIERSLGIGLQTGRSGDNGEGSGE